MLTEILTISISFFLNGCGYSKKKCNQEILDQKKQCSENTGKLTSDHEQKINLLQEDHKQIISQWEEGIIERNKTIDQFKDHIRKLEEAAQSHKTLTTKHQKTIAEYDQDIIDLKSKHQQEKNRLNLVRRMRLEKYNKLKKELKKKKEDDDRGRSRDPVETDFITRRREKEEIEEDNEQEIIQDREKTEAPLADLEWGMPTEMENVEEVRKKNCRGGQKKAVAK